LPERRKPGFLDVSKYQPPPAFTEQYGNFDDPAAIDLYQECCTRPIRHSSAG
jgi:hypothetical protein